MKTAITTEHFHDLGKFMFGYTIFWAYIAFSQFVLIWYANIPEETEFYMVRMEGGWQYISLRTMKNSVSSGMFAYQMRMN